IKPEYFTKKNPKFEQSKMFTELSGLGFLINNMKEEIIEGWVKVYETFDYMKASLIEARFNDEGLIFETMNKADIGYTMDVGNSLLGREAVNMPFKFFVKPEDVERAKKIVEEDRSTLLDDPNLDYENPESGDA